MSGYALGPAADGRPDLPMSGCRSVAFQRGCRSVAFQRGRLSESQGVEAKQTLLSPSSILRRIAGAAMSIQSSFVRLSRYYLPYHEDPVAERSRVCQRRLSTI